jgi:chemosensory pili system protein ChpA (sensor histidine kinase/response regulator)
MAEVEAAAFGEEMQKFAGRVQQEQVRVRADLLDNMVNFAGEINIYRSRLEQQVGSMRFNLSELGQTVVRMRDQLRQVEIETEAQVLFRYEREGGGGDEHFDPLEMDRYSHLQQLSRSMLESVGDLVSIQGLLDNITRESETLLLQQARVNTELQEGLMHTRMVPFSVLAPRMRRILRQACQELGKRAELSLEGAEGEMDRTVIDRIIAPIEHMLRNALAHGIETPEQRRAAGKREAGSIKVSLMRDGSEVVIQLADDGAGMNLGAIRRKAKQRGLIVDDAEVSDNDVMQFILEPGFSTAEQVSQISGRGVGMDVVSSEVKQLGGSLHIDSHYGQGTTFTIRLPVTLAISQALLVQVHEEIYAIPLTSVEGIVRMHQDELSRYFNDSTARFEYGGQAYPVQNLGALLGQGSPVLGQGGPKRLPILLVRSGDHRMALQVESLLGSRETVVKSVGPQISTVRGISGATILGDGRVVLILDLGGLLRTGGLSMYTDRAAPAIAEEKARVLTVMVVDDSITVRKVTTRLLERNDMHVITAKDGVDAVAKLQEHIPDVMLLDIEMPRMDGFELATHVRNEPRLRNIPMIMITSRTGDKHRKRAMEIGVDRYLGKPFQESEVLSTIRELSEGRRPNG